MRRPVFLKLFISYLLLILVVAGLILVLVFQSLSSHSLETSTRSLQKLGLALRHQVSPLIADGLPGELHSLVRGIGEETHTRITVIDGRGRVLADSENTAQTMENHGNRPEVLTALAGSMGRSVRHSTTLGKDMLYIALPLEPEGKTQPVLRMSMPLEDIDILLRSMRAGALELAAVIAALSLLIAFFFSHAVSSPIRELGRASKRIAGGDFGTRVNLRTGDEIQELSESFNDMAERIERSFTEISESREELEGILSSMSEGLLVLDSQGKIQLANRSACEITGTDGMIGRCSWEVIRSSRLNELLEQAPQQPASGEIELNEKVYLCSLTPVRSGKTRVMLLHDITGMKRLEKIKKDLVVNVSHELRTPLTAIKGFTETLMEECSGNHQEYLRIIKRHTDRLMNIITDLLDLSELEAEETRLHVEDVRLGELIENVLDLFGPVLARKNLTAVIEGTRAGVVIKADPFRLEQLFTNLVDNAVKYTENGGITVSLGSSQNIAVIKIADTGVGIPRKHLGRIFERFYTADKSRSRRLGGTGLGLSIVKHIVTLHRGTIHVASRPFQGTTFTITLPLTDHSPDNEKG